MPYTSTDSFDGPALVYATLAGHTPHTVTQRPKPAALAKFHACVVIYSFALRHGVFSPSLAEHAGCTERVRTPLGLSSTALRK